jgi:hypothetical protein
MDEAEQKLWHAIDVGGFAAYGTLFSFTLESIKNRVEKDSKEIQDPRDKINTYYKNITQRFQAMNLGALDKRFPVDVLKELRDRVFPEMGAKFKELDSLLKYFISGSVHLKGRIAGKIKECDDLVTKMGELGIKFSKNDRYWEYRKTNPTRDYLEKPQE